jgi:GT2 family glycosyltransferase
MAILVSILIPSYNAEKWVDEAIQSALSQTWPKKEVIIVDDGSSDHSLAVAKKYESKSVKVISQENKGAAVARNKALEFAQGDYIQWLDADDLLAPDKVEHQLRAVDANKDSRILLTSSWAPFYYRHQCAKFKPDNLWRDLDPVEWLIIKFNETLWMNPAVWLISRKLTELAGPWDVRTAPDDDGEYICRVIVNSEKIKFVPNAKSFYRKSNPKSLSKDPSEKALEGVLFSKRQCIGHLRSLEDSERTQAACLTLLQEGLIRYYPKHTALIRKLESLAEELGGKLSPPVVNWKHSLVANILGWSLANRIKRTKAMVKAMITRNWDKLLYDLSNKQYG